MFIFGTISLVLHGLNGLCALFGVSGRKVARFFRCPGSFTYEELHND